MPVPSPRNKILPARGNYADLVASVGSILDGEICYALDQDQYYQKEGSTLVSVGASKAQGLLADTAVQPGDNVSSLVNDSGYITSAQAPVQPGDIPTVPTSLSAFTNDANYITSAEAPVQPADIPTIPTVVGAFTNDSGYITAGDVPPAYDDSAIDTRLTNVEGIAGTAIQPGAVNPVYFANQAAFPDASTSHGAVAHSHADGAMFFAHGGVWNKIANAADIPPINNLDVDALPLLP